MRRRIEKLTYLLYFLSYFLMLINPGVYWDDWTIFNMDAKGIMSQYYGNGNLPNGYFHLLLKEFSGSPLLYHALAFVFKLVGIFTLFRILEKFSLSHKETMFWKISILIYSIFPHYDTLITMIMLNSTLRLFLFIVATFCLVKYLFERKIIYRILSLILFFLSFFTNSFLVFYLFPFLFILTIGDSNLFLQKKFYSSGAFVKFIFLRAVKYLDFLLLPFLFWFIRQQFFMPSAHYEQIGYNEVKLESLLQIPYKFVVLVYIFVADLLPFINEALQYLELWILFAIAAYVSYLVLSKINLDFKISWKMLVLGIILFLAGAFPYLMVNKYPTYLDYMSRHQLLVGFGASLSFCAIIFLLQSSIAKRVLLSGSIAAFVCINVFIQFSFFKGYMKQEVFQNYFTAENISSDISKTIILEDATVDFTQKGNPVKFYAFAGMLKRLNEKENIVLATEKDLNSYLKNELFSIIKPYNYQYNLSDYQYVDPYQKLVVNYTEKEKPLFPIFTYYGQFFSGNKNAWNGHFQFRLESLPKGEI